jgi:hypothetical protein
VFHQGVPSAVRLAKDLAACGMPVTDTRGYRVDFHALRRHTFASLLANAGVSEAARVKLTRHGEWKRTDHYTDPQSLSFFAEMEKLATQTLVPSPAPNSGKPGQNGGNPVQSESPEQSADIVAIDDRRTNLDKAVPSWECKAVGGERGFRPLWSAAPKV